MSDYLNQLIARGPQVNLGASYVDARLAGSRNALWQQDYQRTQQQDAEHEAWVAAINEGRQTGDYSKAFQIDPETTTAYAKSQLDYQKAQQPPAPIEETTLPSGRVLAVQGGNPVGSPWSPQEKGVGTLYQVDRNGVPTYLPADQAAGQPAYREPKGSGGTIRLPDGTVINTAGGAYAPTEFGKPTRGDLEKTFTQSQGNIMGLQQQLLKWDPAYSTYEGAFRATVGNVKDKAGMGMTPEQQKYLDGYNSWKSDTSAALSNYLNQLSGAAISPTEETRLKASFPTAEDGPTQYLSKLKATMKRLALVQARSAYLLSNPSVQLDSVSLEQMQNVMLTEANSIAASYERQYNMSREEAKAKAIQDVRAKYGIGGVSGQ